MRIFQNALLYPIRHSVDDCRNTLGSDTDIFVASLLVHRSSEESCKKEASQLGNDRPKRIQFNLYDEIAETTKRSRGSRSANASNAHKSLCVSNVCSLAPNFSQSEQTSSMLFSSCERPLLGRDSKTPECEVFSRSLETVTGVATLLWWCNKVKYQNGVT